MIVRIFSHASEHLVSLIFACHRLKAQTTENSKRNLLKEEQTQHFRAR